MKISWTDHVKSGVVHSVREEGIILRKIKQRLPVLVKSFVRTAF